MREVFIHKMTGGDKNMKVVHQLTSYEFLVAHDVLLTYLYENPRSKKEVYDSNRIRHSTQKRVIDKLVAHEVLIPHGKTLIINPVLEITSAKHIEWTLEVIAE
jgi:hypothetical protein